MRNLIMAAVAVACLAGAGPAQAQYYYYREESPSWSFWTPRHERYIDCRAVSDMPRFSSLDRNDDGYLSSWELRRSGFGWRTYNELDLNNNGVVSRNEVYTARRSCD